MTVPSATINVAVNLSGLDQDASSTVSAVTRETITGVQVIQGPRGIGVPEGGTIDQILTKDSSTNNDTSWRTPPFVGKSELVYNVKDYGAVCDGTTNDTVALRAALAAAAAGQVKHVMIFNRVGVDSTIVVPNDVVLDCTQGKIVALPGFTPETPVLKFGDSATNNRFTGMSPKLDVDCGGQRLIGIEFSKPWQRAEFFDVIVYNFTYKGIVVTSGYGLQLYSYNLHAVNLTGVDYQFNADADSIGLEVKTTDCYFGPGDIFGTFIGVKATAGHNKFEAVHPFGIFQNAGVPQSMPMGVCFWNSGQNNVFMGCIADSPAMIDYTIAASSSNGGYGFYDVSSGYQSRFIGCTTYVPDRSGVGEAAPVNKMIGFYCGNAGGYYGCQVEDNVGSILTKFDGPEKTRCFVSGQDESNMVYYAASYASTNWQRFRQYWNGSTYTMQGEFGGAATGNDVRVGSASTTLLTRYAQSSNGSFDLSRSLTNANAVHTRMTGSFTQATGTVTNLLIAPTVNQSGTAGYIALQVSATETTTGSGSNLLLDLEVGGASKLSVANDGLITASNRITSVTNPTSAQDAATKNYVDTADALKAPLASPSFTGDITYADGLNIVAGATTGTKIGTSTSQKFAFFNSTPIVQPGATTDLGTLLSNLGLRASGTAYPITTSGNVSLTGSGNTVRKSYNPTAVTTATTLTLASSEVIDANGTTAGFNITPPATTNGGYVYTVTKIDASANAITLVGTFNGTVNPTLAAQWKYMSFITTAVSGVFRIISDN